MKKLNSISGIILPMVYLIVRQEGVALGLKEVVVEHTKHTHDCRHLNGQPEVKLHPLKSEQIMQEIQNS